MGMMVGQFLQYSLLAHALGDFKVLVDFKVLSSRLHRNS
jgi:hypothetical protein